MERIVACQIILIAFPKTTVEEKKKKEKIMMKKEKVVAGGYGVEVKGELGNDWEQNREKEDKYEEEMEEKGSPQKESKKTSL